jgi:hypothetical protein
VRRRHLVVPVLFFLSGVGWAAAHAVAHRAVVGPVEPKSGLEGYLSYMTTSTALCLALALPLAAGAVAGRRWRGTSLRSLWLFGLVPLVGFVGHSVVEPVLSGHGVPAPGTLAPFVLLAVLVQATFALSAVALARHILSFAEGLARTLAGPVRGRAPRPAPTALRPRPSSVPAFSLGFVHAGRGPPPLPA